VVIVTVRTPTADNLYLVTCRLKVEVTAYRNNQTRLDETPGAGSLCTTHANSLARAYTQHDTHTHTQTSYATYVDVVIPGMISVSLVAIREKGANFWGGYS
jgi:hypothetical protein